MKRLIVCATAAALFTAGCSERAEDATAEVARHGRYAGVGLYPAGQMWSQVAVANAPKDTAASRLSDDEQIIVVVDSVTGEVRQCGNLSGFCVGMNPWRGTLPRPQITPIPLFKHADQLAQDVRAVAKQDEAKPDGR